MQIEKKINYNMLPAHMQDGMQNYIMMGIRPGNFLCSVLENDLVGAFSNADDVNARVMRSYATFLYWEAPAACWGSKEKVDTWIAHRGIAGMTEVKADA